MSDHQHNHKHEDGFHVITLREIVSTWWKKRLAKLSPIKKKPVVDPLKPLPEPIGIEINHLAIVIDGKVQEVIKAQNRLAAMLLSEPTIVKFDPNIIRPKIGWVYDGEFFKEQNVQEDKEN